MNAFEVLIIQSAKENSPEELTAEKERISKLIEQRFVRIFYNTDQIRFQTDVIEKSEENKTLYSKLCSSLQLAQNADLIYFCDGFTRSVEGRIIFEVTDKEKKPCLYEYNQKMVKCAKSHECNACRTTIQKGEYALHETGRFCREYINNYYCQRCISNDVVYLYKDE